MKSKNDEGFTALHYAAFSGNVKMIKMLVHRCKADIHAKNKQGLGMMHLAAQGDQPWALTYFRDLGLSCDERDHSNQTALHWAS